jgi:hypothetical protein
MSNEAVQKGLGDKWDEMPTWQKWALGVGGVAAIAATGGAAAYAIATYGATVTVAAGGTTVVVAVGKAALS